MNVDRAFFTSTFIFHDSTHSYLIHGSTYSSQFAPCSQAARVGCLRWNSGFPGCRNAAYSFLRL